MKTLDKQPSWTDNRTLTRNEVRQGFVENWLNGCEFSEAFLNSDLYKLEDKSVKE